MVDELVRFRLKVRQYALATPGAAGEARKQQLQERQPLLEACDALRQDLITHGINVKVSNTADKGTAMSQETVQHRGRQWLVTQSLRDPLEADVEGWVCVCKQEQLQNSTLVGQELPCQASLCLLCFAF